MPTTLGDLPHHYERLGLKKGVIEPREDGLRTNAGEGSFEWWYLDTHLDDGSKMVITFYTKPPNVSASRPLMPFVSFLLDRPDGTHVERGFLAPPEAFAASSAGCDVRIGNNTFKGDLKRYTIHVEIDDIVADVELTSEVPSFRPATGHVFFGEKEDQFVAWFPAVPQGSAKVELSIAGVRQTFAATAYHDHNWGNTSLRKIIDHWYWARARVGDYTIIGLMFMGGKNFGSGIITSFMLAKAGEILVDDQNKLTFTTRGRSVNEETGVPYDDNLIYEQSVGDDRYGVTFSRTRDLYTMNFGPVGAYIRFGGTASLERHRHGELVESGSAPAIWELLHFGERSVVS